MSVEVRIDGAGELVAWRIEGRERLGEASSFDVELHGPISAAVKPAAVLGHAARIALGAEPRVVAGVVTRFAVIVSDRPDTVAYRARIESRFANLAHRRLARTFSSETIPDIVAKVVRGVGYEVVRRLYADYPPVPLVAQYQETDAAFVRRLCEAHGLFFRFEATDAGEAFVLEDDSREAQPAQIAKLTLASRDARDDGRSVVHSPKVRRRRRPGKVTVRDYSVDRPNAALESSVASGSPTERDHEIYLAPGGFASEDAGESRAELLLESFRADAETLTIETARFEMTPGYAFDLEIDGGYQGLLRPEGSFVVVASESRWHSGEPEHDRVELLAVPLDVPYRLPLEATPRPRVSGIQSAVVVGEDGQEIDPDALGRVYLRFHWDVHGDENPRENPPFRVMQNNAPGAFVVPRVGWEVLVAFEDGDPTRPYVLGRSYNAKQPPPQALPENRTVSSFSSDSTPGGGARTTIQFNDAAGHEHLLWHAPHDMHTSVANNRVVQTGKHENEIIGSDLTEVIGGAENVSIDLAWLASYGSRGLNIGATQAKTVGGNHVVTIGGAEVVLVGGALLEQVGNPVAGAAQLAMSVPFALAADQGGKLKVFAMVAGIGRAALEGYAAGGAQGARASVAKGAIGAALTFIPGGDALMSGGLAFNPKLNELTGGLLGSGWANAWDHGRPPRAATIPGGGGSGTSGGDAGPAAAGPGFRNITADGLYAEAVGGSYRVMTPGPFSWMTLGASLVGIGGTHVSSARSASFAALGGLVEKLGSANITAGKNAIVAVKGPLRRSIAGIHAITAGGAYTLVSKNPMMLKVAGPLNLSGSTVTFKVSGVTLSSSPAGVKLGGAEIIIKGDSAQLGPMSHSG